MSRLALTLCGRVTVQADGSPPTDASRPLGAKALALLAYLAVEGGAHARARLAALLWGDHDDEHARASLRQALAQLRRALGPVLHDEGTTIVLAAEVTCDVDPLLRGDDERPPPLEVHRFLTELAVRDAPAFEEWAATVRERLRTRMAGLLARAAAQALAGRDARGALAAATRWRLLAPLDDEPVLAALRAHEQLGDAAGAVVLVDAHARRLREEEGRRPGSALRAAAERIALLASRRAPDPTDSADAPAGSTPAARAFAAAPLQEREAEWEQFARRWRAARGGVGGAIVVDGETGSGRSRLLRDWGAWVDAEEGLVLAAPSVEADRAIPFGTVARLVQAALAADGAAGTDGRWLAELARLEPALHARFPGVPVAEGSSSAVDGWRVFEALAQLLAALTAESPVLVLLDDLPRCDAESAGLLHALVERTRATPLLWCVGASPGAERDAAGARLVRALVAAGATVLRPAPLGARGVWGILGALGEPLEEPEARARAAALVAGVRAESEGAPRYVVALLRALLDRGALVVRDGRWQSRVPPGGALPVRLAELPDVRAPLVARLERVPEDARELLVTVALAAVPCDADLLSHVHTMSRLRAAALGDALRARGLLVEEHGAFRCAHRVIAAVVAAEASAVWRQETHRALAESLRRLRGPDPAPAVAAAVAYHTRMSHEGAAAAPVERRAAPVVVPTDALWPLDEAPGPREERLPSA